MTRKQEELYREMEGALLKAQGVAMPAPADRCYWIANDYWELLKKHTPKSEIDNEMTAIEFFRNTKPKFTGLIQYYTMLSEVMLFVPQHSDEQKLYWKGEQKRYTRFYEKNEEFIDYYDSCERHMDAMYFTRVKDGNIAEPRMRYDEDVKFCSQKDHIVRGILAHRMYLDFVTGQLKLITK